jgi:hypothetical protein
MVPPLSTGRRHEAADGEGLALAGLRAFDEGGGEDARTDHRLAVLDLGSDQVGRPVFVAHLEPRDTADGREEGLIRRELAPAAMGGVGRKPGVQQGGVRCARCYGVETAPLQLPREPVEHSDVGCGKERAGGREACKRVEIEGDDLIVAVPAEVAGVVVLRVAAGRLDLDDLGHEAPRSMVA